MRNIICLLFIVLFGFAANAQPKGYQPVKDFKHFQQALTAANTGVQTISSDFNQVKHLAMLSDKIRSKGKFYYKREDKVHIEYTSPFSYLLVMNGGQLMVKDEQKTSRINTRNSKAMQSVNRIIIDCMRGTVFQNPDFKVSVYESSSDYLLSMAPANESMGKMFRQIDVYLNKSNFDVRRLTMTEQNGDYTDMDFINTHHNLPLNDALFKVI